MPVRRADRAAWSRPFARRVDADVGLCWRTISVAGDARTDGHAHRLFGRRFCLCAGPPAQYLAEPVAPDGRDFKSPRACGHGRPSPDTKPLHCADSIGISSALSRLVLDTAAHAQTRGFVTPV